MPLGGDDRDAQRFEPKNGSMKLNNELTEKDSEVLAACALGPTRRTGETGAPAKAGVPKRFRRLKWNELVSRGDFVVDEHKGYELWQGPTGFRANSFMKTIYRQYGNRPPATKKTK